MASKFSQQANKLGTDLGALFNRGIRQALVAGLVAAVQATKHDSSNAAAHWMIAAKGRSRPGARKAGRINDWRGSNERASVAPVGKRRDAGIHKMRATKFVRERELREVVEKLVAGRLPETVFYFYHPLEDGEEYAKNAEIKSAGEAGVAETLRVYQNRIAAGNARKNPL